MINVPMVLPTCPSNPDHGQMVLRPIERQTSEQRFCGTWYDCPRCHSSILYQSPELVAQLAEQQPQPPQRITQEGNTFEQRAWVCKQYHGEYSAGIAWFPVGSHWKPYSPQDLPATVDNGTAAKDFPAKQWRQAQKYARELCGRYNVPLDGSEDVTETV